jgi:Kef-type K+ transport system membrane component KefB
MTNLLLFFSEGSQAKILLSFFVILVAAKLMAEVCERLGQPATIGEILAGAIIGPSLLNFVQPSDVTNALAAIGVVFLLFSVGLETHPTHILKVGATATLVAALGVVVPLLTGWALLTAWPGHTQIEAIFLGATMVATSVGITARVLSGLGLISSEASRVVLAAAVIDDIIGLLVLAVVTSLAEGRINYLDIGLTTALAVTFTMAMIFLGTHAVRKVEAPVSRLKINHSLLIFALILCFGLATVASFIGIAGIVGAFLGGVALSETCEGTELSRDAQVLTEFAAPFFLVNIGMSLDLNVFRSADTLILAGVVTLLAIVSKVIGCGIGAARMGPVRALQVGVGMIPRGEVGMVVAQIGLSMGVISGRVYGVVLIMVVATTLVSPFIIKQVFARGRHSLPDLEFAQSAD